MTENLTSYLTNRFLFSKKKPYTIPFSDDPHITVWEEYFKEAKK